jgi:multiple sugar transport system substrate-binding protein
MKAQKPFYLLSVVIALSMILAACGTLTTTPTTSGPTKAPSGKAKVVLFVGMSTGTTPEQTAAEDAMAAEFNATHPNIEMSYVYVPYEQAKQRFLTMLASGDPPQLACPVGNEGISANFDTWADITPFIKQDNYDLSDFPSGLVDLQRYSGKLFGLPLGLFPSMIFYNKDIFDAAGIAYPPTDFNDKTWTMAKLRDIAMQLTLDKNGKNATDPAFNPGNDGENVVQWGYDDSYDGSDLAGTLTMWDSANKGRPTTADYKTSVVNSPEWTYGFTWLSDGVWKDHFIAPMAVTGPRDSAGTLPFIDGKTAMFYGHTWWSAEALPDLKIPYGVAPLPFNNKGTRLERLDADTCAMPSAAANKAETWEVLKWLYEPAQLIRYAKIMGYIPARTSLRDQYKTEILDVNYPGLDSSVLFGALNYPDVPNHESYIPEYSQIRSILANAYTALYSGTNKDDPTALLNSTNAEVQAALDKYWASH